MSGTPLHINDFQWNASFNISFNHNNIESLGAQSAFLFQSGWAGGNAPFDYTVAKGPFGRFDMGIGDGQLL